MPDYKASDIAGTTWQRCRQVVIDNPVGGTPTVRFDEQEILAIDGREIKRPAGTLALAFDAARSIPLRDPVTGALTGKTTSYGDAYVLLYSAYIAAALARDEVAAPTTPPTTQG